jgi:hypothetical protein
MRAKVTESGLLVPRDMLQGISEVDIRRENDIIILTPVGDEDPLQRIGRNPVDDTIMDGAENHDRYLYKQ